MKASRCALLMRIFVSRIEAYLLTHTSRDKKKSPQTITRIKLKSRLCKDYASVVSCGLCLTRLGLCITTYVCVAGRGDSEKSTSVMGTTSFVRDWEGRTGVKAGQGQENFGGPPGCRDTRAKHSFQTFVLLSIPLSHAQAPSLHLTQSTRIGL